MTVCMYCEEEIYGGKGDWWHKKTENMACETDEWPGHLAQPKLPPLPEMIPLDKCEKGGVYAIQSRNLMYGTFDGDGGFIGWRTKCDSTYLFTEYHRDTGPPFGTVRPLLKIGDIDESIPIIEQYPQTTCSRCGELVEFVKNNPSGRKGKWFHTYRIGNGTIHCDDPLGTGVFPIGGGTYQPLAYAMDEVVGEWEKENTHPLRVQWEIERN